MSQEIGQVKIERDNGHEDRWAFGKWFYRKESQKYSLAGNRVGIVVVALFSITATVVVVRGPSQRLENQSDPIDLRSDVTLVASSMQSIPAGVSDGKRSKGPHSSTSRRAVNYKGAEHVERPRLTVIPPGVAGEAILLNAATDGNVRAKLTSDVEFNGELLLPKGATLIGVGSSGDDRLKISFSKVVFADGKTQDIAAEALDPSDQLVGLKGSRVSRYGSMIAAAGVASFTGGLTDGLQETETQGSTVMKKSNLKNATLNGLGRAAIDTSNEFVADWKKKKTAIQVQPGTRLVLSFN